MELRPEEMCIVPEEALAQLQLFHRQYQQLLDLPHLTWPADEHLRNAGAQEWIYERCFQDTSNAVLPPERYRLRVLKPLLSKIEKAIVDPDEDVSVL